MPRFRGTTGCRKCDHYRNLTRPAKNYFCNCYFFQEKLKAQSSLAKHSALPKFLVTPTNSSNESFVSLPKIEAKSNLDVLKGFKSEAIQKLIDMHTVQEGDLCNFSGCNASAMFVCNSCDNTHRCCATHINNHSKLCRMIDNEGMPANHIIPEQKRMKTLLVSTGGWEYIKQKGADELLRDGYFPASGEYPELAFSIKMLHSVVNQIEANGLSYQGALNNVLSTHRIPPPVDIESRFRQVVQLFLCWKIELETNKICLPNDEKNTLTSKSPFMCPVCFSDPDSDRIIILLVDGCFSFKHFVSRSNGPSNATLDYLYYIQKDESISIRQSTKTSCSNLRAGDGKKKSVDGLDINGLFGAVCVHGIPYKIIDISCGETAEYVAAIVQTFKREFPKARLILGYDIACILDVLKKSDWAPYQIFVPGMHVKSHTMTCQVKYDPKYMLVMKNEEGEDTERLWAQFYIGRNIAVMTIGNRRDFISAMTHSIAKKAFYNLAKRLKNDFESSYNKACIMVEQVIETTIDYDIVKSKLATAKENILERYSKESFSEERNHEQACVDIAREIASMTNSRRNRNGTRMTSLISSNLNALRQKLNKTVDEFNDKFPHRQLTTELIFVKAKESPLFNDHLMAQVKLIKSLGQIKATIYSFDTAIQFIESSIQKDIETDFLLAKRKRDSILLEDLKSNRLLLNEALQSHPKISRYYRSLFDKLEI